MKKLEELYKFQKGEGTFRIQDDGTEVHIADFYPEVLGVQDTQEGEEVIINLLFVSGMESESIIPISKIDRINWFQLDKRCLVDEDNKNAQKYLKQLLRMQIASCANQMAKLTQYTQLGWNTNAYGNAVYVTGNLCIGGTGNEIISPALKEYQLQICEANPNGMLQKFVNLFCERSPIEGRISILYFFTGLIRQLYKEAGTPVDFVLYIFGKQQNRKTTLAKLTNNLYNRGTDMDFSVRTVAKTSCTAAEKLIDMFKDATLILDDVSKTGNKGYQQTQENIMESVVRMLGNRARKSSNSGNGVKEYFPNSNVIITGEYLPNFPESTLSRMILMEVTNPVDSVWLEEFGREPLMLSTVAYMFVSWVQSDYNKHVDFIRKNFEGYCQDRNQKQICQGRILDHLFIMFCTSCLLKHFLGDRGYNEWEYDIILSIKSELWDLVDKQEVLMQNATLKNTQKDFCRTFAEMYVDKKLELADKSVNLDYAADYYDGFIRDKHIICMKTAKLCRKMQDYYKDTSITVQEITKQFRANRLLITDNSMHSKATKKVNNVRYLHISKGAVKDYHQYCCQETEKEDNNEL